LTAYIEGHVERGGCRSQVGSIVGLRSECRFLSHAQQDAIRLGCFARQDGFVPGLEAYLDRLICQLDERAIGRQQDTAISSYGPVTPADLAFR
jgi:hypothetical protein